MACLDHYRGRYDRLLTDLHNDVEEFLATGRMEAAVEMSRATGQHFNHNEWPLFFTGDLDASFVLVHLNPKQADNYEERAANPRERFASWEENWDFCRHYGAITYGREGDRKWRSRFDQKQIRFIRPFKVIEFADDGSPDAIWINLERVVDHKLQMELIPYGSDKFSTRGFAKSVLQPHYDRLMSVITAVPRKYVFFCGSVFEPILRDYIVKEHRFRLTKKDGTLDRATSRFANLLLPHEGRQISAGLAHSWPRQGIPMTSYAEECRDRYPMNS
jgi:hypothetical protein